MFENTQIVVAGFSLRMGLGGNTSLKRNLKVAATKKGCPEGGEWH